MGGSGGSAEESGDVAETEGSRAGAPGTEGDIPGNWILQHHKYRELMALDVGDTAQVYAAFLVYLDLLEERRWQEVTSRGSAELQLVYLEGRESESQPRQLIVPLPGQRSLSHQGVRSLLSQPGPDGAPSPSLLLAAVAPDSTLAYYRFSRGFVVPEPPDSIQALECGRERRKRRRL